VTIKRPRDSWVSKALGWALRGEGRWHPGPRAREPGTTAAVTAPSPSRRSPPVRVTSRRGGAGLAPHFKRRCAPRPKDARHGDSQGLRRSPHQASSHARPHARLLAPRVLRPQPASAPRPGSPSRTQRRPRPPAQPARAPPPAAGAGCGARGRPRSK
jgi:hypothetical protein